MTDDDARPAGISRTISFTPELEALRGWAILLVFLFHADGVITGYERIGTVVSPALAFITAGHSGVTLFFVLSAYLLSRPFLEEGRLGRRVDRRRFFSRRVLRIMPLYSAAVLVALVLTWQGPSSLLDALCALFFLNSFTGTVASMVPYSAVWWSLATEVQFYLLLPALGFCLRSKTGQRIGLAILVVWAIAYVFVALHPELLSKSVRFRMSLSVFGRAPAFLAGIGASWLVMHHGERLRAAWNRHAWMRNGGADLLLLAVLFGLGRVLQHVTYLGFIRAEVADATTRFAESALWTAVLLLVLLAPLRSAKLITNRVFSTLGMLSYSLYLIHEPVLFFGIVRLVDLGFPLDVDLILRVVVFGMAFLLCTTLSAVTYRFIERPFLVRKAKIDR